MDPSWAMSSLYKVGSIAGTPDHVKTLTDVTLSVVLLFAERSKASHRQSQSREVDHFLYVSPPMIRATRPGRVLVPKSSNARGFSQENPIRPLPILM